MNTEEAFAAGSEDALRSLIEQYGPPLLRYCHGILCDYYEAQDAVQETFLKAYTHRDRYRPDKPCGMRAWLYRIAYTSCVDLLRRRALRRRLPAPVHPQAVIREDLQQALLSLGAADRALLLCRALDDIPYEQLETVFHVSAAALRKRYERAKKKIVRSLAEADPYYARLEESQ